MCVAVKLIELEFSRTRPKYVKAFSSKDHWIERSGVHVRYCEKKIIMRDTKAWFTEFQSPALQFIIRSCSRANSVLNEHISSFFSRSFKLYANKKPERAKKKRQGTGNRKYYFVYTRKRIFFQICGRPLTISVLSSTSLLWHLPLWMLCTRHLRALYVRSFTLEWLRD